MKYKFPYSNMNGRLNRWIRWTSMKTNKTVDDRVEFKINAARNFNGLMFRRKIMLSYDCCWFLC